MTIEREFLKFNIMMSRTENFLTESIVLGGLKIPLGIIQTISAISGYIFINFFGSIFSEDREKIKNLSSQLTKPRKQ